MIMPCYWNFGWKIRLGWNGIIFLNEYRGSRVTIFYMHAIIIDQILCLFFFWGGGADRKFEIERCSLLYFYFLRLNSERLFTRKLISALLKRSLWEFKSEIYIKKNFINLYFTRSDCFICMYVNFIIRNNEIM